MANICNSWVAESSSLLSLINKAQILFSQAQAKRVRCYLGHALVTVMTTCEDENMDLFSWHKSLEPYFLYGSIIVHYYFTVSVLERFLCFETLM